MADQESVFLGGVHRGLGIGAFPDTQNVQNQLVKSFSLSFLEHRVSLIALTVSILYEWPTRRVSSWVEFTGGLGLAPSPTRKTFKTS
jgi:hypothetical protein